MNQAKKGGGAAGGFPNFGGDAAGASFPGFPPMPPNVGAGSSSSSSRPSAPTYDTTATAVGGTSILPYVAPSHARKQLDACCQYGMSRTEEMYLPPTCDIAARHTIAMSVHCYLCLYSVL